MLMNNEKIKIFMCYLTIFSFVVFGNALTFNLGNRLPIKISEIIALITMLMLLKKNWKSLFDKFNISIYVWIIIGFLSAILNMFINNYQISDIIYGMLYEFRILYILFTISLIVSYLKSIQISVKKLFDFIVNSYLIVCFIGFIQLIFYPEAYDFYDLFYSIGTYFPNPDPHKGRLLSTYFDPNFLACCLNIPLAICLVFWKKYNYKYLIKFFIILLTIILTVSRSGILYCCVIIFLFVILSIMYRDEKNKLNVNKKILVFTVVTIIFGIVMLFSNVRVVDRILDSANDQSTHARFDDWKNGLEIVKENPLIGIGYNMIGIYKQNIQSSVMYGNDSSLLLILITTGLLGAIYVIITFLKFIISNFKQMKNNDLNLVNILIFMGGLVCCNFNNLLFYILWLFTVLLIFKYLDYEEDNIQK